MATEDNEDNEELAPTEANPWAEKAKEDLSKPFDRPEGRLSISFADQHSLAFVELRQGDAAGAGEASAEKQRIGSARGWHPDDADEVQLKLSSFQQEIGLIQPQLSGSLPSDDPDMGQGFGQQPSDNSLSADSAFEDSPEEPQSAEGDFPEDENVLREKIIRKKTVAGVISTYKDKNELQSALERRAALKFIQQKRADVDARLRALQRVEEQRDEIQGHLDEIDGKIADLQAESERLFNEDQFANRDRIRTLKSKVDAIALRRRDEASAMEREVENEDAARREYNNALIEFRRVEEIEASLLEEERHASIEAKVLAEYRAHKETEAALRFEQRRRARGRAAAEQRRRDLEETDRATQVAKTGRVAAIHRVKAAKAKEAQAEQRFLDRQKEEREMHAEALVTLKSNMENVANKIRSQNHKKSSKQKLLEEQRKQEMADILAAGGNPYAVWRKEDQAKKKAANDEARLKARKEQENRLLHMLTEEERRRKKQEQHENHLREAQKEFQYEVGGQAKQAKIQKYMMERTVGGKDVLDPTGRETRIYPSKVTVMLDWRFGLGMPPHPRGAEPGEDVPPGMPTGYAKDDPAGVEGEGWRQTQRGRIIEKVAGRYPGETFNQTLAGSRSMDDSMYRQTSKGVSKDSLREDAAIVKALDGDNEGKSATDAVAESEDEQKPAEAVELPIAAIEKQKETMAIPEFTGLWDPNVPVNTAAGGRTMKALSKLEQKMMSEAMARKKAGYGWIEPQVVWGKEFKGTAFVPSEKGRDVSAVVFKDFEPGKVYSRKVTLTNASYAFNTFKLMELPDSIKDFFNIEYTHPGSLSPGMTCDLHITFEPKINQDIEEFIPLMCQTGPQNIPLQCYTRKAQVSTKTPMLELDVILGESLTKNIVLVNSGALDTPCKLLPLSRLPRVDFLAQDLADAEAAGAYSAAIESVVFPSEVVATSYSTTKVEVTFTPAVSGETIIPIHVCMQKGLSTPQSPDLVVLVKATAHEVPIYVLHPVIDFKCCAFDQTYSEELPVCNRGKVALKVMPRVGKELHGFVRFSPDMAYVQARDHHGNPGHFEFQIKFAPQRLILERCKEFLVEGPTGKLDMIEIPVDVGVPDQKMPVHFTLRVQLTEDRLEFSRESIDFGDCAISESVAVKLGVCNRSELPTRVGFPQLPREVTAEPNTGFMSLLPHEERFFTLTFSPLMDVDYSFNVTCITGTNKKFNFPCKARGFAPPLAFSCSNMTFRACAVGDRVTQNLACTNMSKTDEQTLEILVPCQSGIKVSPLVATIPAGKTIRIQIDFCPLARPLELLGEEAAEAPAKDGEAEGDAEAAADEGDAPDAADNGEGEGDGEEGEGEGGKAAAEESALTPQEVEIREALHIAGSESLEDEEYSTHDTWQLPVFIKGGPVMYLQVATTTVLPSLVGRLDGKLLLPVVGKSGFESLPQLAFGELPVGQERVQTIAITNISETGSPVYAELLDPFGPFSLLKSPTFMEPEATQGITVAFRPKKEAGFKEKLVLVAGPHRFRVLLTGQGVSPSFQIEGLVVESGQVDGGDVVVGEAATRTFTLVNNSPFPVTYSAELQNVGEYNESRPLPFDCTPCQGSIPASGSQVVTLSFSAAAESLHYAAILKVIVPNQKEKMEWRVCGRGWRQAMYLFDPNTASSMAGRERFKDQVDEPTTANPISLRYTFPQAAAVAREEAVYTLRVGNCGGRGAGELVWNNAKEAADAGVTLEPAQPKVDPGSQVPIVVTYAPPAGGGAALGLWRTLTLSGVLKGGDPAPQGGTVPVDVQLRIFVPAKA